MAKKVLAIRADEDEIARWKVLADGMSLSEWVRMRCNGALPNVSFKPDHVAESRRMVDHVPAAGKKDCGHVTILPDDRPGYVSARMYHDSPHRVHSENCRCQMCCK